MRLRMGLCGAGLAGVAFALAIVAAVRGCSRRQAELAREIFLEHPRGRLAWFDKSRLFLLSNGDLDDTSRARRLDFDGDLRRVAWSSDGRTAYVLVSRGTLDETHRLEAVDAVTLDRRVLLDLASARLEDDDIDAKQVFVAPWADAEAEADRVYFRLGTGEWYSVEGKRSRVRPEAGPPELARDQLRCPAGRHWVEMRSLEGDCIIEVKGEGSRLRIDRVDRMNSAAWFCE